MKNQVLKQFIGVLALLCSSAGMAGTIEVVASASNSTPIVGDPFTVTVSGAGFPETAGATLGLSWDSAVVSVTSVDLAVGSPFPTLVADSPFNLVTILGPLSGTQPSGSFDAFTITFTTIAVGAANIFLTDDQADFCWVLAADSSCIPVSYIQANVTVLSLPAPDIVVTDTVDPIDDQTVLFGNVDLAVDATETVTVTNSGNLDLNISFVTSPTGDFSIDDTCTGVVPASANCTITVHFIPTANGPASSSFDIVSDDDETPTVTVNVSGSGGLPDIAVTDADGVVPDDLLVEFGDVQATLTSSVDVTITNNGPGDLHLGTVTTPADTHFTLAGNTCGATLTPLANCAVTVQFAPTATGVLTSSFDIPSDDPGTPTVTVDLSGNGTPAPTADIAVTDSDPSPDDHVIAFGEVEVGQTSAAATVTVTNNGAANLVVSSVAGLAAPFTVTGETCTGAPIVTSATCTITVVFSPTAVGPAEGDTLTISSNDPDSPTVDVLASGTGTAPPIPDIAVTDSDSSPDDHALSFGNVEVGQTSPAITVTVANTGGAGLVLGTVAAANGLPAQYTISNDNCSGTTVPAAGNCTFEVQFAPTAAGPANDAFDIPSNDPDENPVIVNVSGNGLAPNIVVTGTLSFGDVQVGQTSAARTVTVTNNGTANLTVSGVAGLAAPFAVTGETCTAAPIAVAGTCAITVTFSPTAVGPATSDTLTITSNDLDTPTVDVVASGTGTAPEITVTGSPVAFGDVVVGNSPLLTVTVTNSGTAALIIGDVGAVNGLEAPFFIDEDNCSALTLNPAASCTIVVEFVADDIDTFPGDFDIPSNDADEASVVVTVSGSGVEAPPAGGLRDSSGGSALGLETLLGLGLVGVAMRRRRRPGA